MHITKFRSPPTRRSAGKCWNTGSDQPRSQIGRAPKKPDWDNIGKIVCDSLNLVSYHDDSAVVDAQVRKFYSETPRVDVMIKVVGPDQI